MKKILLFLAVVLVTFVPFQQRAISARTQPLKPPFAVSIIIDTPQPVSAELLNQAKWGVGRFFSIVGKNLLTSLIITNGEHPKVILPLARRSAQELTDALSAIEGAASSEKASVVEAYRLAAKMLQQSGAHTKGILLITHGRRTCNNKKLFCKLSKQYKSQGINTGIIRYLLDGSSPIGSFTCKGANIFYGIDAGTPKELYGRKLMRTLFRARREFLSNYDYKPITAKQVAPKVNMQCLMQTLGKHWLLMEMSEVRGAKNRKKYWITIETPFELIEPLPLEPIGKIKGFGKVEAGAEDLYRKTDSGGIDSTEYYLELYEKALNECSDQNGSQTEEPNPQPNKQ